MQSRAVVRAGRVQIDVVNQSNETRSLSPTVITWPVPTLRSRSPTRTSSNVDFVTSTTVELRNRWRHWNETTHAQSTMSLMLSDESFRRAVWSARGVRARAGGVELGAIFSDRYRPEVRVIFLCWPPLLIVSHLFIWNCLLLPSYWRDNFPCSSSAPLKRDELIGTKRCRNCSMIIIMIIIIIIIIMIIQIDLH